MLKDDLNEVFFDEEEFATELIINSNTENSIACIFDTNTEVIFDRVSEYGESVANIPSALMKKEDAEKIEHDDVLLIEGDNYVLNYKDDEDVDLVRVYLEKRREA